MTAVAFKLKPLNPRSPDTKYVGDEPLWREQPTENRFTALSRAFNWYNYFYGKKEAKDFVATYLDRHERIKDAKKIRAIPDSQIRLTTGWLCRMSMMGLQLDEHEQIKLDNLIAELLALKEQAKEERQQALKAFRINQAIQIAQSIAGAALAVLNAFATVPYPASIAAAAAATATGAATIATVAAQKPQFHQGGVIQANVLPGEGVANRDLVRAVGEQGFNAMNRNPEAAAQALSGGTTLIIGRQVIGEIGRNLMVGRSPVSQAINGRARAGQVALGTSNLSVVL